MNLMANTSLAMLSLSIIFIILWDAFESLILPRRVAYRYRLSRFYYVHSWKFLTAIARRLQPGKPREQVLGYFGPLSLLGLLGMWGLTLLFMFAVLHWSAGTEIVAPEKGHTFATYLYMSGSTFFTLGYGDITPLNTLGRFIAISEAGLGLAFLAIVIGYLPVVYGAFSKREINISLLDARAGSPPSAVELLARNGRAGDMDALRQLLADWERWSGELLESHLSYPALLFFRSQHENQSWLTALTCILDVCAMSMVGFNGAPKGQARLTFAMARHALVDLAQVLNSPPRPPAIDRLPAAALARTRQTLTQAGVIFNCCETGEERLTELRALYEPYANALAERLFITLPPWLHPRGVVDNWQTSAWERNPEGFASTPTSRQRFDYAKQVYVD